MNKPLVRAFGQVLRKARESKDLSQEQLAHEAELDRTYVSMLERGVRQPTISTLHSLAESLGTRGSHLLSAAESGLPWSRSTFRAAEQEPGSGFSRRSAKRK